FAYRYLRTSHSEAMGWSAIKSVWASAANITMTTMQDVLSLGADARMNIPSTLGGNWAWRVRKEGINPEVARMLREITETYKRYKPYRKK
ncbi:MAG: 4-alpha-glucanotransferase, partial [Butyricicoccus sp.]